MKGPNNTKNSDHYRDLLVPYLEDMLNRDEKARLEEHLSQCPDCTRELEEIREWTGILQQNKEAFCPEPWELFDYVRAGRQAPAHLADHVERCAVCKDHIHAFETAARKEPVPAEVRKKVQSEGLAKATQKRPFQPILRLAEFSERFSAFFRIPALALASVAAVLLLVVLLYPTAPSPVIGLSADKWEPSALERLTMGSGQTGGTQAARGLSRPRMTLILLLEDVERPITQAKIDSLYRELRPGRTIRAFYEIVSPAKLREAVIEKRIRTGSRAEIIRGLHYELDVAKVVVVTVSRSGERFDVESQFTDTATGKVERDQKVKGVGEKDLGESLRETAYSVVPTDRSNQVPAPSKDG